MDNGDRSRRTFSLSVKDAQIAETDRGKQRLQKRAVDIGAETDEYLPLGWSETATNAVTAYDSFTTSIHRLVTFSLPALGLADLFMNWRPSCVVHLAFSIFVGGCVF
jgi:hypothetical protein